MIEPTPDRIAYSAREAARLLGIDRARISAAISAGELPAYRLGRRRYAIRRDDLDRWLSGHAVGGAPERVARVVDAILERERQRRCAP